MTPAATPRGGTVFDIGYQRYTGPREGRTRGREVELGGEERLEGGHRAPQAVIVAHV